MQMLTKFGRNIGEKFRWISENLREICRHEEMQNDFVSKMNFDIAKNEPRDVLFFVISVHWFWLNWVNLYFHNFLVVWILKSFFNGVPHNLFPIKNGFIVKSGTIWRLPLESPPHGARSFSKAARTSSEFSGTIGIPMPPRRVKKTSLGSHFKFQVVGTWLGCSLPPNSKIPINY